MKLAIKINYWHEKWQLGQEAAQLMGQLKKIELQYKKEESA